MHKWLTVLLVVGLVLCISSVHFMVFHYLTTTQGIRDFDFSFLEVGREDSDLTAVVRFYNESPYYINVEESRFDLYVSDKIVQGGNRAEQEIYAVPPNGQRDLEIGFSPRPNTPADRLLENVREEGFEWSLRVRYWIHIPMWDYALYRQERKTLETLGGG